MGTPVQVAYTSFVGGLITEVGKLNFPENASVDELNCDLHKDGNRSRRLGMEYEVNYALSTETVSDTTIVSLNTWKNVGEQSDEHFVVLQVGSILTFYKQETNSALSQSRVDTTYTSGVEYSLDMSAFNSPYGSGAGSSPIEVSSIKGVLVVASPNINTFYIERDKDTGAFTATEISFRVRDYEYLGDTSEYGEPYTGTSVSIEREYDTYNTGWVEFNIFDPLSTYKTATGGNYPALNLPWYSGKDAAGQFNVDEWNEIYAGNTVITNGHYILNLYEKDRDTASGLTGVPSSLEKSRFSCIASYAGRVFYSGMGDSTADNGSKIFFTQLVEFGLKNLGKLHSVNDPTSESLSDLLDTDGGYVTIPNAHQIKKLHVFGAALYVFADNGVWKISGVDDVFRATEYSVSKISEDGLLSVGSFVNAQGRPYWWSTSGIFTFVSNELGDIRPQNISISTIQKHWDESTSTNKDKVQGVYDEVNRRVMWLYPSSGETIDSKKNEILLFDEVLQAFFPWRISDTVTDTPYIIDAVFDSGIGSAEVDFNVVGNTNDYITDSSGNTIITTRENRELSLSLIKFVVVDGATGKLTFAEPTSISFLDWGSADYESFVEAGYTFLGDFEQRKTPTYITVFCKSTEEGWAINSDGTGYEIIRPSGLLLNNVWDFDTRYTATPQQAYRLKNIPVVNVSNLNVFGYPNTMVATRVKLRGRGRVVKLKFYSETGKDFNIAGYNVIATAVGRY